MHKRVVIVGGGVAGLSAAQELCERGFEVTVFEEKDIPGGKARSVPVPDSAQSGNQPLPGEHGFRYFSRFYRHLPDTMKRIPYGKGSVYDNLIELPFLELTASDPEKLPLIIPAGFPSSLKQIVALVQSALHAQATMQLEPGEMEFFTARIYQILTSANVRRLADLEKETWWQYLGAATRSPGYQAFMVRGLSETLVAAKPTVANTKVDGDFVLQQVLALVTPGISNDRVLNGPTNDVWINPWLTYLTQKGVQYHLNAKVHSINCDGKKITSITVERQSRTEDITADYYLIAVPVEKMADFLDKDSGKNLLKADPTLFGIKDLAKSTAWMNGIQFYLNKNVDIVRGHVLAANSPWALTAVSQKQLWPRVDLSHYGDGMVRGIISVDISAWDVPGTLFVDPSTGLYKTAQQCTRQEIMEEVWSQLKQAVNYDGHVFLTDEMLHSYYLDGDILDVPPNPENGSIHKNTEPLFISKVYSWMHRPEAHTQIPNMFLAADYVRTNTQLATMEGANEAARRAVNCIIAASGSCAPLCKIYRLPIPWPFKLSRLCDEFRYQEGRAWRASKVAKLIGRAMEFVVQRAAR